MVKKRKRVRVRLPFPMLKPIFDAETYFRC